MVSSACGCDCCFTARNPSADNHDLFLLCSRRNIIYVFHAGERIYTTADRMTLLMFPGASLDTADAMKDGSKVAPACFLRHFGICKRSSSHCAKISTSGCKDAFRKQRIIDPADCDDRDIHDRKVFPLTGITTGTVDITGNGRTVSIIEDPALFLNDIQIFL